MTIDLKTLEIGDTVHFKCGGSAKVNKLNWYTEHCDICFNGERSHYAVYSLEGLSAVEPFSIIRIEKPAFDWSTVKWGMGFIYGLSMKLIFIGRSPDSDLVYCLNDNNFVAAYHPNSLTRAPAFDIKGDEK